jgi:hypothetical protein
MPFVSQLLKFFLTHPHGGYLRLPWLLPTKTPSRNPTK